MVQQNNGIMVIRWVVGVGIWWDWLFETQMKKIEEMGLTYMDLRNQSKDPMAKK